MVSSVAEEEMLEQEEIPKADKKAAKKEAKARKKQNKKMSQAEQDGEPEEEVKGSKLAVVAATIVFVVIWLGILGLVIKADIGGFGSTVLYPILKDVPYINKILPDVVEKTADGTAEDAQYPYATLADAIARIKELELELSDAQSKTQANTDYVAQLESEVARLQGFENEKAAFEEEKTKFYNEVVFGDHAPDIKEYKAYYESIDSANAEILYKQVVEQEEADTKIQEYAKTYAEMKPKQAAAIMEQMTDNLELVANILKNMDTAARGSILGAMNSEVAARITKIMEP